VLLDRSGLLPLLGAAAERNSLLPVQVIGNGAFLSLATVISFVGQASEGTTIARAQLVYDNGAEARADVKSGNLELMPLAPGQSGRLSIHPRHGINAGFGAGRAGTVPVSGGALGVVFDGRGRPIQLPGDSGRRRELLKKWLWTLGG
jgi:hypothetical protein